MTANEMADELDLKLDRNNSFGSPGYEDFDYSSVLTEAYNLYVKKFIDELNNRKLNGFQETEQRDQVFGALIRNAPSLTLSVSQVGILQNEVFYDLPTDHMYTIYEHCTIDKFVCGSNNTLNIIADILPIAYNEIRRLLDNKYKRPYYKNWGDARVWRTEYSRQTNGVIPSNPATPKRHGLFTDGTFNILSYTMNYLKNPSPIVVNRDNPNDQRNCELDESSHLVIVEIATNLMLNRVKEQAINNIESLKDLE
jgi:hypothetical protein